jgi:hypothetical protein
VDFAQLVKSYRSEGDVTPERRRYSSPICTGAPEHPIEGSAHEHIPTSYVERQNLNMRMGMRRFTRVTNAFSNKVDNHCRSLALCFLYYNFVRMHKSSRMSPNVAACVSDRLWEMSDIVGLIEACEARKLAGKEKAPA